MTPLHRNQPQSRRGNNADKDRKKLVRILYATAESGKRNGSKAESVERRRRRLLFVFLALLAMIAWGIWREIL